MRRCTPLKQRLHPQLKWKAPIGARKAANAAKRCGSREVENNFLSLGVASEGDGWLVLYHRALGYATDHREVLLEASNQ
jgi:hypothetical protein